LSCGTRTGEGDVESGSARRLAPQPVGEQSLSPAGEFAGEARVWSSQRRHTLPKIPWVRGIVTPSALGEPAEDEARRRVMMIGWPVVLMAGVVLIVITAARLIW
jgi:hypothetical protein